MPAKQSEKPKAYDPQDTILASLQALNEHDLTTRILLPLFRSLGYQRAEYTGGNDEEGKDIVCWREDEFGDVELAVAQVKRYRPSRKAADKRSFSEIVTQLSQSLEKPVPHIDGMSYLPSIVYFVSPFSLDTQILQSRFEGIVALRRHRVKVMDGPRIVRLMKNRAPDLITSLCGPQFNIHGAVVSQLTNWDLLSALDFQRQKPVDTFYTDIDFCLGKDTTRLFLLSNFTAREITEEITRESWVLLKHLCELIREEFGADLLLHPAEMIDRDFEKQESKLLRWHQKMERVRGELQEVSGEVGRLSRELKEAQRELRRSQPEVARLYDQREDLMDKLNSLRRSPDRPKIKGLTSEEKALEQQIAKLDNKIRMSDKILLPIQAKYQKSAETEYKLKQQEEALRKEKPGVAVQITLHGSSLSETLQTKRAWVEQSVETLNTTSPTVNDLRTFLSECSRIFENTGKILSDRTVMRTVGIDSNVLYRPESSKSRLKLSIHHVFQTGLNLAVLGEAGAGKTTNLQMYAYKKLSAGASEGVVYAPLARVVRIWLQGGARPKHGAVANLEDGISMFLASLGVRLTPRELMDELVARKSTLLLDGIDEAIKAAPWILDAILSFSARYPGIQVITSSRVSGRYVEDIPFLAISLLPFTPDQRRNFISQWFGEDGSRHVANITKHLDKNPIIGDIIRTPLLATILCVLEENGVPLPDSEVRMYEERMRLLLGDYDIHKQATRITSKRYHLQLCARKLAFRLHMAGKREEERHRLYKIATAFLDRELDERRARLVVDELVDPCNVLVPMTEDGRIGFGHLVYQEYLAALELMTNREVNILQLLGQPWWRGTLVLYARMCDSIEWLVRRISIRGSLSEVKDAVIAMINARPAKERSNLNSIFKKNVGLDELMPPELEEFGYDDEDKWDDLEDPWYE